MSHCHTVTLSHDSLTTWNYFNFATTFNIALLAINLWHCAGSDDEFTFTFIGIARFIFTTLNCHTQWKYLFYASVRPMISNGYFVHYLKIKQRKYWMENFVSIWNGISNYILYVLLGAHYEVYVIVINSLFVKLFVWRRLILLNFHGFSMKRRRKKWIKTKISFFFLHFFLHKIWVKYWFQVVWVKCSSIVASNTVSWWHDLRIQRQLT